MMCVSLKGLKNQVQVKMNIVSCPPVTTVLIKRPDLKYQLGFSVQNGIVRIFHLLKICIEPDFLSLTPGVFLPH